MGLFFLGLFLGSLAGLFLSALCAIASKSDDDNSQTNELGRND